MMTLDPLTLMLSHQAVYMEGTDLTVNKLRLEIRFPGISSVKFWRFTGTTRLYVLKRSVKTLHKSLNDLAIWYLWYQCLSILLVEDFEEWYDCCLWIVFAYHTDDHFKLWASTGSLQEAERYLHPFAGIFMWREEDIFFFPWKHPRTIKDKNRVHYSY